MTTIQLNDGSTVMARTEWEEIGEARDVLNSMLEPVREKLSPELADALSEFGNNIIDNIEEPIIDANGLLFKIKNMEEALKAYGDRSLTDESYFAYLERQAGVKFPRIAGKTEKTEEKKSVNLQHSIPPEDSTLCPGSRCSYRSKEKGCINMKCLYCSRIYEDIPADGRYGRKDFFQPAEEEA